MKFFRWITAIVLVLSIIFVPPVQAFAAEQTKYISDISIGYGDEGKASLESEGYTVWQNLNANEGGNGSAVWIGYKTTLNENEAITDIALMNMKGGYSFDAYTKEIETLYNRVSEQLSGFKSAIAEFRTNYNNGNPFAKEAKDILNGFTDDESENKKIGDIFLDETTSDETLHRIFLEGNSEAISAIEQALALACVESGNDTIIARIEESEYPDELNPELNSARIALSTVFSDFHNDAVAMLEVATKIEEAGGADEFFANDNLTDEEEYYFGLLYSRWKFLSETDFGNSGMSLFKFAMLDEENENDNGEVLEDEYLEMLAQSMTPGQLGIVTNVGIMTIIFNALAAENEEETVANLDKNVINVSETISVYFGVDRQLFENTDGIALTNDSLREKAAAQGNNFGKDANADKSKAIILSAAAAAAYTAGAVLMTYGIKAVMTPVMVEEWVHFQTSDGILHWGEYQMVAHVNVAGVICTVIGVIAIVAAVVLTIFALLSWIEKPVIPNTEYTEIPRVIVEKPDGQKDFIAYYAARLAGASENEQVSTKLYGDLNALNTIDQWLCLYYSKNPSLGQPLTDKILISSDGILKASEEEKYKPVHMFGSDSAANLNQYNTKTGAKNIYLFISVDNTTIEQSGSIFTQNHALLSIVALFAGAGIAAAVTYCIMRKKESKQV